MSNPEFLQKVTAFVTRGSGTSADLLLFVHPFMGSQLPAGTVEPGESTEAAVSREASEETGLHNLSLASYLGGTEEFTPEGFAVTCERAEVFARPDAFSFNWAALPRGVSVELSGREEDGFVQVTYTEHDRFPEPAYVTMAITGWVRRASLTTRIQRHFFHLTASGPTPERWQVAVDNHRFELFWAPLLDLPVIVTYQRDWLELFWPYWHGRREQ